MVDGCRQEKGVPHVRTHDDRHTGLPRPLPQLRRPPGLLRRPVGDPRACEARRGNAIHGHGMGGVLAVFVGACAMPRECRRMRSMFHKSDRGRLRGGP